MNSTDETRPLALWGLCSSGKTDRTDSYRVNDPPPLTLVVLTGTRWLCDPPFLSVPSAPRTRALCVFCVLQLGSVACSPVDCTITCTYPFHPDGECCPVCQGEWDQTPTSQALGGPWLSGPVSAPADCNYEGRKVANGQVFTLDDEPCTQCTCRVSWVWELGAAVPGAAFCLLSLRKLPSPLASVSPSSSRLSST